MIPLQETIEQLYERDFVRWTEETSRQLKAGDWENLDRVHLIGEIESLGNEERRKVNSYLKQLLLRLLLYRYWTAERANCARGWSVEITNFRDELEALLASQTLYNYSLERIDNAYFKARRLALQKTGLEASTFPDRCPFSIEQLFDADFLP